MASFSIAVLDDSPDSWGPVSIPDQFKDVPYYSSFNKSDRLGKAADWQSQFQNKPRYQQRDGASQNTIFNFYYQDDESSFQLVDNTRAQTRRPYTNRRFQNQRGNMQQRQPWNATIQSARGGFQQQQQQQPRRDQKLQNARNYQRPGQRYGNRDQQARKRDPSVAINAEWRELDTIEFSKLNKLDTDAEPAAVDLKLAGSLEFYDKNFDRINSKSEKSLQRTDRVFYAVSASDDPIISEYAKEDAATVFATDSVLSHLMAATRSVYSWDIVVEKRGSKLFFDKRVGSAIDQLTVNETATEPPSDEGRPDAVNSPSSLADEALLVNQAFSQQVISKDKSEKKAETVPHPFVAEGETPAAVAYKYRKWTLADGVSLVARTEVDGLTVGKGKTGEPKELQLTIRALNEYGGGTDWKKKIDLQRGALLATEMKNNGGKLAKWTLQSFLAGTDLLKIGFVTRQNAKDNAYHTLLAVQDYNPKEFATNLGLSVKNSWAVLKYYVELLNKQEDGTYLIFREPDRNAIKVYAIPSDAFDVPVAPKDEDDSSFATNA
eukprot:TRINITY_DN31063_c0_g1_i1.p1 TRINITY_DN31063_c0_g1~~TRINITY_DN31063_c0_g1_i1.p1  ORF type:complete len:548 (+),score=152.77 TRINITY_DN31063_c0_g1_i1:86-1729(+)